MEMLTAFFFGERSAGLPARDLEEIIDVESPDPDTVGHRAVAEFVNVETMFARLQASEFSDDFNAVRLLREGDFAFHFVFAESLHDGNCHRVFGCLGRMWRGGSGLCRRSRGGHL